MVLLSLREERVGVRRSIKFEQRIAICRTIFKELSLAFYESDYSLFIFFRLQRTVISGLRGTKTNDCAAAVTPTGKI